MIAAFVAQYPGYSADASKPKVDAVVTILPDFLSMKCGSTARGQNISGLLQMRVVGWHQLLQHGLDRQLHILCGQLPLMGDNSLDQLRLGHGFPFVFKRLDQLMVLLAC